MKVLNITSGNFETEVRNADKTVLLDFWADWCAPCRMLAPVVEQVAEEAEDIRVGKVNVDEQPGLAGDFEVTSIPTLVVIKNGTEVNRSVGVISKSEILELVK